MPFRGGMTMCHFGGGCGCKRASAGSNWFPRAFACACAVACVRRIGESGLAYCSFWCIDVVQLV